MPEHVTSADGTPIAYEREGQGPAVVLVAGALCDRGSSVGNPARVLAGDFTVYRYDRRGRGDSGDSPAYAPQREVEDLAAVAAATGTVPYLYGHSSGGVLALLAVSSGLAVRKLAVYEPPFILEGTRPPPPAGLAGRLRELIGQGRRADALRLGLVQALQFPAEALGSLRASPSWPPLLALAHTLAYDLQLCGPGNRLPEQALATLATPTLVLYGSQSPAWARASAKRLAEVVPGARAQSLPGQGHNAEPEVLAPALRDFYLRP